MAYEFPAKCGSSVFQFKISLPANRVWRRVLVPCDYNFKDLHFVIQNLFSWSSTHMYKFNMMDQRTFRDIEVGGCGEVYDYDYKWVHESTKLHTYFKKKSDDATYDYDFGSTWCHDIFLEKIIPADPSIKYPKCIDGRRGSPPEHGAPDEVERYDPDFFDPKLITFQEAYDFFDEDQDFRGGITPQNSDSSDFSDNDDISDVPKLGTSTTKLDKQFKVVDSLSTQNPKDIASSALTLKKSTPEEKEPKSMSSKPIALESKGLHKNNSMLEMIRAIFNSDSDLSNNADIPIVTEDAEESFGKLIASQMRGIKDLKRREDLRIEIQRLIGKYRFNN